MNLKTHKTSGGSARLKKGTLLALFASMALCCMESGVVAQRSIKLYPKIIRVQKGKTKTVSAAAYNTPTQPSFNAAFTFTSSNPSVATLSNVLMSGDDIDRSTTPPPNLRTVTGVSAGTTTLSAVWNGTTSDVATVIVDDPAAAPTAVIRGDNDASGGLSITTTVGEPIELDAESSRGVNMLEWNWGDGDKTSELLSATHAYLVAGSYQLTLKITNKSGQVATSNVTVNVTPATPPTRIISVSTIQQLLAAYNSSTGGEHIVIPAGTVLIGQVELPAKNFSDYVTIRSSAAMPDVRDRVTPDHAGLVTFRGNGLNEIPFTIKNGASKIRLAGLKFEPKNISNSNGASTYYLLQIGEAFTQTSYAHNPTKIIVQHCVINPPDNVNVVHGVLNDGYKVSIVSSWLGNIKTYDEGDSQAVLTLDGRGAHVYNNTFFEAASENIMYGGAVPQINGHVPTNIEVRRSHFSKRLSWRVYQGQNHRVNIKNLFETKNARRLYIESSVFENHWDGARSQTFALVFKSTPSPGSPGEFVPWAISEDIVVENTKLSRIYGGVTTAIDNYDLGSFSGLKPSNIVLKNVLFDDLSRRWGIPGGDNSGARLIQPNSVEDLKLDHVTVVDRDQTAGEAIMFVTNNNFRLSVTNSIFALGGYGIIGGGVGAGISALNPGTSGATNGCNPVASPLWNVSYNVMATYGSDTSCYPKAASFHNSYPTNYGNIGFVNLAGGNYKLAASSPYRNTSSDGKDPGMDQDLLNTRTSCSVSGNTAQCLVVSSPNIVSVSGRILGSSERPVIRAQVEITDTSGRSRRAMTNPFGWYHFRDIPVGDYVISISAKNRVFGSFSRAITQNTDAMNFEPSN